MQFENQLNALRSTYMNIFSQIFENSINIECICKTESKNDIFNSSPAKQVLDRGVDDFMDSDDETPENGDSMNVDDPSKTQNSRATSTAAKKICDLSCFEQLKFVSFSLKSCLAGGNSSDDQLTSEDLEKFEKLWSNYSFLVKNPKSCDYNGTTIFHIAAIDNALKLLKVVTNICPSGVLALGKILQS